MKNSNSFVDEVRNSPYYNAFDPYEDFCQVNQCCFLTHVPQHAPISEFMEEAKHHAHDPRSHLLEPEKEKLAVDKKQVKDENTKKTWKVSSIISWFGGGKLRAKKSSNPAVSKPTNVSISDLMCGSDGRDYPKPKHQLSGSLNSLFTPLKRVDTVKANSKDSIGPYGPMYTVR